MNTIGHFIDGKRVKGASGRFKDIFNPNTGEVQSKVSMATPSELDAAVVSAQTAQRAWANTNPQRRSRILFAYKQLVEANMDDLAAMLSSEHGKVLADSRGDVIRGVDVIEFACGIPHGQKGEHTYGAGPEIDVYSMRKPLGVVAGITPFNFPAMIPMWMFGMAIATGNACILKPSEKDPSVPMRLAELFVEAGGPVGLLQCINGDKEIVDAICDNPTIKAVSFVGSSDIAQYVYARAAERFLDKMLPAIEAMKVGVSEDPDADYGPVVTAVHRDSIKAQVTKAVDEGAELLVDGREFELQGYEDGFFIGPSLLDNVTPDMETYQDEIFGPVLQIVRANTFEEALKLPSEHQYGNGVAIFTQNGRVAREFADRVEVGMVGINVPIPVPVAYHSFGGWKRSAFGDANQYGMEGLRFYTKVKTVTQRWPEGETEDSAFIIPTF